MNDRTFWDRLRYVGVCFFLTLGGWAVAQAAQPTTDGDLAAVRQAFLARYPQMSAVEISPTPFSSLYEVRIENTLFYTDAQVNFLLQGTLLDTQSGTNLTEKRQQALNRVDFSTLPLDLAIKQVRGSGKYRIATFEDPNCRYCKQLHQTLAKMDDVTVYTFLFPILSEDSSEKARNLWCASDRTQAWLDWMLHEKAPATAHCDTPIDTLLALGHKLHLRGTPALFFADGSRVNGALPQNALQAKLQQVASGG